MIIQTRNFSSSPFKIFHSTFQSIISMIFLIVIIIIRVLLIFCLILSQSIRIINNRERRYSRASNYNFINLARRTLFPGLHNEPYESHAQPFCTGNNRTPLNLETFQYSTSCIIEINQPKSCSRHCIAGSFDKNHFPLINEFMRTISLVTLFCAVDL